MREAVTTGIICLKDKFEFEYRVAVIKYILREDETYTYQITPNYSVIDLLGPKYFQGIPGLNLDLHKASYVRENITPVFISERTPGENREDLWELLKACDMEYLNRLEWLIRTDLRYSGDLFYVVRYEKEEYRKLLKYEKVIEGESRSAGVMHALLTEICLGNIIMAKEYVINDENRKGYFSLLMSLYQKEKSYLDERKREGIRKAASEGRYRGRKPIAIDTPRLEEVSRAFKGGLITEEEALNRLGVSRSTFYRRMRKLGMAGTS